MRRHYCVDLQFGRLSDCSVYYVQLDDLGVAIYARSRAGRTGYRSDEREYNNMYGYL